MQVKQFKNKEDLGDVLRDKENMHCVFLVFYISAKWTTLNSHIYQSSKKGVGSKSVLCVGPL